MSILKTPETPAWFTPWFPFFAGRRPGALPEGGWERRSAAGRRPGALPEGGWERGEWLAASGGGAGRAANARAATTIRGAHQHVVRSSPDMRAVVRRHSKSPQGLRDSGAAKGVRLSPQLPDGIASGVIGEGASPPPVLHPAKAFTIACYSSVTGFFPPLARQSATRTTVSK